MIDFLIVLFAVISQSYALVDEVIPLLLVPKLNSAAYAVRKIRQLTDVQTARLVYFSYFHSILSYGILFGDTGTPQNSSELLLSPGMPSPYQILDQANKSLSELSYLNNNEGLPSICFTTFPNKTKILRLNDCCYFPPLFPEKDFKKCNFHIMMRRRSLELNPNDPEYCSHFKCVLSRSKLLNKDNNTIDIMKVYDYLNEWVIKNPYFTKAVNLAKDNCVDKELPASHPCPSKFVAGCVVTTIAFQCPMGWQEKPECSLFKELLSVCGPFVIQSSNFATTTN